MLTSNAFWWNRKPVVNQRGDYSVIAEDLSHHLKLLLSVYGNILMLQLNSKPALAVHIRSITKHYGLGNCKQGCSHISMKAHLPIPHQVHWHLLPSNSNKPATINPLQPEFMKKLGSLWKSDSIYYEFYLILHANFLLSKIYILIMLKNIKIFWNLLHKVYIT